MLSVDDSGSRQLRKVLLLGGEPFSGPILMWWNFVAPLLLVATVVLSFAAALGVSALAFDHLFGFAGADPSNCQILWIGCGVWRGQR
jgi:uncharacterized membrane protein YdfJ with MMPL/SSD domain